MDAKEETIDSTKGAKIFVRSWQPDGPPKAVVVLCPGFNSHSGRYIWPAEQLVKQGYAVCAVDLRGRGKSSGERFYVEDIAEYVADVTAAVKLAKAKNAGLKVFLLGHSAGGVVSAVYTVDNQAELAGFICESFAFQVPAPGIVISAMKGLSHLAPHLPVLKLKNSDFSRDPQAVEAMNNDPLIANETQPTATIAALARADEKLMGDFPKITIPVLILHGTMDKATVPAGSQFFFDHTGSMDKTLKLYDGHFHDLLADIGKVGVMGDITGWLDKHV
ncbi:MAG: lysophospholipase [Bauldia sp.]